MAMRKVLRRGLLPLAALLLLSVGSQSGRTQNLNPTPPASPPHPPIDLPLVAQPPVPHVVPAPAPTVDALIAQLEELRKQKAELEARELALVGQLSGLLKDQSERLRKLGVVVLPGTPKKEAEQLRKVEPAAPSPPSGDLFRSDLPSPPRK